MRGVTSSRCSSRGAHAGRVMDGKRHAGRQPTVLQRVQRSSHSLNAASPALARRAVRMASLLASARAARNHALRPDQVSSWPSTSVDFGRLSRQCQRWRPTFGFVYAERDDAHLYILCLGLWGLVLMSWYVMYHT